MKILQKMQIASSKSIYDTSCTFKSRRGELLKRQLSIGYGVFMLCCGGGSIAIVVFCYGFEQRRREKDKNII